MWGLDGFAHERTLDVAGSQVTAVANEQRAWNAEVAVTVTVHDQAGPLGACLESIAQQEFPGGEVGVVVVEDGSSDDWAATIGHFRQRLRLIVCRMRCGSPARARNAALSFVDAALPRAQWVARLDADDRFSTPRSLASACALGSRHGARWVLGGNRLVLGGSLLGRENAATEALLRAPTVLSILQAMSEGTAENELPSCNLLLRPRTGWRYPEVESAEDHWLVTDLLLNHTASGAILTEPPYCDYNLGGEVTAANRRTARYMSSRQALFAQARKWAARLGDNG
ncbi:glycosyltransferase [Archangium violaceum]|uniref:glycosyltransferase n=1 Tax=Archangium violaceum TaxID=83451 RepID=UPI0036DB69C4